MRQVAGTLLAVGLCATPVQGARDTPPTLPPFTAAYQPTTVDERGMWMAADEDERQMRDAPEVIRDPALNAYARGVLCRTVGPERCAAIRLYIVRIPMFNATTYANGMMTLWSGALLRLDSEAELAAMFGHEFSHFELRHSLSGFQRRRSGSDLLAWAGLLGAGGIALPTMVVGGFYRFSRAQEAAADMLGFRYLAASGYRLTAPADLWTRVMAEQDATEIGRHRKPHQRYVAGFFDTHPTELTRATYLRAAAAEIGGSGGADEVGRFRAVIAPWLPSLLADQIKRNDFGGSEYLLDQLAADGWTTPLLFARGELYRDRGNPRDLITAAGFYQQAIAHGDAPAEAYRGLGLALLRSHQVEPGRAALRDYLARKPDAADAAMIATLIAA